MKAFDSYCKLGWAMGKKGAALGVKISKYTLDPIGLTCFKILNDILGSSKRPLDNSGLSRTL